MPQLNYQFDTDVMIHALKESIGEDGILFQLFHQHVPGSPESKILFKAWAELVDLQKEKANAKAA